VATTTIRQLVAGIAALSALVGCTAPSADLGGLAADAIDYNWHVRPILSENCFKCHGPDPSSREAGLRLDLRDFAVAELPETPGKHAIVPGSANGSELARRIRAANVDERMPPESSHKTLSAQQIAILEQWIENGAEYQPHWAFIAPQRPAVPNLTDGDAARNEIDRFVVARLQREGLTPASEADRETLINRVTLTLTGLPPTLADVDAFVADAAPDAYERLVDRLLASSAYAEHMAGYWLDLARFSETDGFLDDHHDRLLWPWRDWVIDSFARNRPFDEFGTWQLAGDLLPNATREQILATAYLRVGKRTTENGAIDAEYKAEYMVERTDNALGVAFLGLTVGCARCHDHKYDPITQADYYSLGAFFNSNDEPGAYAPGFSGIQGGPTLPWPDDATAAALDTATANVAARSADHEAARAAAQSGARPSGWRPSPHGPRARSEARSLARWLPITSSSPRGPRHSPIYRRRASRTSHRRASRSSAATRTRLPRRPMKRPSSAAAARRRSSRRACRATTTPSR
jgi:hypothetical protein